MIGRILQNRYEILKPLGKGGFGKTYLAKDLQLLDEQCAVKHLQPKDPRNLDVARRLFYKEAEALKKLGERCEYIPRLFAYFEEQGQLYLVQQFIEGQDLSNELTAGTRLSEEQVIQLLQGILSVLEVVHHADIIHRDLKPANIVRRRRDGQLFLIDFGAVKEISGSTIDPQGNTKLTMPIGTPGYMPQEQIEGRPQLSSDVYAVGMIGIQALTGISPESLQRYSLSKEIKWRDRAPDVSDSLADILDKMVRFDWHRRYTSAVEARQALNQLNLPTATQSLTPRPNRTPQQSRNTLVTQPPIPRPDRTPQRNRNTSQRSPSNLRKFFRYISITLFIFIALYSDRVLAPQTRIHIPVSDPLDELFSRPRVAENSPSLEPIKSLIVIPPQFDEADNFSSELAGVREGESWNYIRKDGKKAIKNLKYEQQYNPYFSEGLARVKLKGKWGYVDQNGEFVIQPKFDDAYNFSEGLARVNIGAKPVPPETDEFGDQSNSNPDAVEGGKWGYINRSGNFTIQPRFENAKKFSEGLAAVQLATSSGNKWGFIDKTGKRVIQPEFKEVGSFSNGVAAIRRDSSKSFTFINKSGDFVTSSVFEGDIDQGFQNGLLLAKNGEKMGYRNQSGKWAIQPKFDEAKNFSEGLARVKINDQWGYISRNGNLVIPVQFAIAEDFSEGLAVVRKDNKCGYIDTRGKFVTPLVEVKGYEGCPMGSFSEGRARVNDNGKWGYIRHPLNGK